MPFVLLQRVGVIMMVSGKYCLRRNRENVDTGFEPGVGQNSGAFEREWIE